MEATRILDFIRCSYLERKFRLKIKKDIEDQHAGLSFINDLRPVNFNWKKKKDVDPRFPTIYEEGSDERCNLQNIQ